MKIEEALKAARAAIDETDRGIVAINQDLAWHKRQLDMHAGSLHRIRAARIDGDITMLGGSEVEAELSVWLQTEHLNLDRADARVVALTAVLAGLTGLDINAIATHELDAQEWTVSATQPDPMAEFITATVEAVALVKGAPFDEPLPASPDCPRDGCATTGFHAVDECTPKWVVVDNEGRPMFLRGDRETAHMWTRTLAEAETFTEDEARGQVRIGSRHERAVTTETAQRIVDDYVRRGAPVPPRPAENDG